jgi:hypothetical protein
VDVQQFRESLKADSPPGLALPLQALWHDARGDWHAAHEAAQADQSPAGAWVHAYLHRKEGDNLNAGYWYRRAGKPPATSSLTLEWEDIACELLSTLG